MKMLLKMALLFVMLFSASFVLAKQNHSMVRDAEIVSTIENKIAANKTIHPATIKITSKDGIVKLEGTTMTDNDASNIVEIAESTPGVRDTDTSELKVQESNQPMTDTYITAKVKGKFVREKLFGDKEVSVTRINVETKNGIVYLTGSVNSKSEAENAAKLAKSIEGVKKVEAKLDVSPRD